MFNIWWFEYWNHFTQSPNEMRSKPMSRGRGRPRGRHGRLSRPPSLRSPLSTPGKSPHISLHLPTPPYMVTSERNSNQRKSNGMIWCVLHQYGRQDGDGVEGGYAERRSAGEADRGCWVRVAAEDARGGEVAPGTDCRHAEAGAHLPYLPTPPHISPHLPDSGCAEAGEYGMMRLKYYT